MNIFLFSRVFIGVVVIFLSSCNKENLKDKGRVNFYDNNGQFAFTVSDKFYKESKKSKKNKINPKITEKEAELLDKIMLQKKACLSKNGEPKYLILTRQEKIYDVTYAKLIEQNYKAKPITPITYFGKCNIKPNS